MSQGEGTSSLGNNSADQRFVRCLILSLIIQIIAIECLRYIYRVLRCLVLHLFIPNRVKRSHRGRRNTGMRKRGVDSGDTSQIISQILMCRDRQCIPIIQRERERGTIRDYLNKLILETSSKRSAWLSHLFIR